jgi:hypothetical protein
MDCALYSQFPLFFVNTDMNFTVLSDEFISSLANSWKWNTVIPHDTTEKCWYLFKYITHLLTVDLYSLQI